MVALRMDGTPRPTRDNPQALMRKLAREWFKAHPICRITFHWRRALLGAAEREMIDAVRTAEVRGNRVQFAVPLSGGIQRSEMPLDGLTSVDISTGNLVIEFGPGRSVEYTPA
jgi:hypothetical protein